MPILPILGVYLVNYLWESQGIEANRHYLYIGKGRDKQQFVYTKLHEQSKHSHHVITTSQLVITQVNRVHSIVLSHSLNPYMTSNISTNRVKPQLHMNQSVTTSFYRYSNLLTQSFFITSYSYKKRAIAVSLIRGYCKLLI